SGSDALLVRGDGPGLGQFNVTGILSQPSLDVFNNNRAVVASNTGWTTGPNAAIIPAVEAIVGAFNLVPLSADSALVLSPSAGSYTMQVSGVNSSTGVALAEVYEVPASVSIVPTPTSTSAGANPTPTPTPTSSGTNPTPTPTPTPTTGSAPPVVYPLKASGSGTYLVDQNNRPFFMVGDDAWALITQLSNADVETYLADRSSRGFNVLWVAAADNISQSNAPRDFAGDAPFDGADFTSEDAAYWAHVDYVIQRAQAYGITLMLSPAFVGLTSSDGYLNSYGSSSPAVMTAYGAFLGNRYRNFPNIVWVLGGDADPANSTVYGNLSALATGIKAADPGHLMTFEASRFDNGLPVASGGLSSLDAWPGPPSWLNLNWVYQTAATVPSGAASNYARAPFLPPLLGEDWYELEHSMTGLGLRQEGYGAVLSGATLGRIFGNNAIWTFNSPNAQTAGDPSWQSQLGSAGSVGEANLGALFRSREHWKLVPDANHTVLTAGFQSGSTLALAARTSDGQSIIAYVPVGQIVTIDLTKIADTSANAWWFNPQTAATTFIGAFSTTASRNFTPPDSNDWVLVVDALSANLAAPGR
ncbi:MAG TPA: DUF4038 domain-containing protein, partial [Opitutaceae bacterium]